MYLSEFYVFDLIEIDVGYSYEIEYYVLGFNVRVPPHLGSTIGARRGHKT